ncbi:SUMF1/EgtB/PvdO family nonheme iron enzyme [Chloroflexota bacterium]
MTDTMLCPHCQTEIPAGSTFCSNCGQSTTSAQPGEQEKKPSKVWVWILAAVGLCAACVIVVAIIVLVIQSIKPKLGTTKTRKADGMVEIYIPEGEFSMGSNFGDPDEKPVHKVTLDAFWIDKTEVTNQMYQECVDAGVCNEPTDTSSVTNNNYFFNPNFANYPVIYVTWYDAVDYCEWVGARLPTEAEWEKAARGDDARDYPWGNLTPTRNLANFDNNLGDTSEVGSYPEGASPYGVLDMAGNAYEWVNDRYDADYYEVSPLENPMGSNSGTRRVLRSASFNTSETTIRASNRGSYPPDTTGDDDGFRCARDAE